MGPIMDSLGRVPRPGRAASSWARNAAPPPRLPTDEGPKGAQALAGTLRAAAHSKAISLIRSTFSDHM